MEAFKIGRSLKLITAVLFFMQIFALIHGMEASICTKATHLPVEKPKVVLVHGFSTGGYSWYKVRFILEMSGYDVTAVDLKASGIDPTDISEVNSFEEYNEPLDRFMAQLPENNKVVLVGGSAGGISVTKVLHDHPEKVLVAIYLAATMLKSGIVTCEDLEVGAPGFNESRCHASCPTLPKPTCFEQSLMGRRELPLQERSEDSTLGKSLDRPGPLRAILTANFTDAVEKSSRVDDLPRVFVKTLSDRVLIPEQQEAMIKLWPPCEVIEINNGHDILSVPQLLAALIVNATMYGPS